MIVGARAGIQNFREKLPRPRPDASVSVPSTCAGAHASDGVSGSLSVSRSFHIKRAIMLGTLAAAAPARAIYLANAFARA